MDLLDLADTTDDPKGYNYILLVQDPFTRYMYGRPLRSKGGGGEITTALDSILAEADLPEGLPKQVVHDSGGEFRSVDFQNWARQNNILDRFKSGATEGRADSRATLQNISILDAAIAKVANTLEELQRENHGDPE